MTTTDTASLELTIRGMDCADCARTIESALEGLSGVTAARVLFTAGRGTVTYDPHILEPQAIVDAVNATGYTAQISDSAARAPEREPNRWPTWIPAIFLIGLSLFALGELLLEGLEGVSIIPWPLALAAVAAGAWPIARRAIGAVRQRRITADLLMSIAILAALVLGEFVAALLITFFMRVANALESFTTTRARHTIRSLVRLTPEVARVLRDEEEVEIASRDLRPGDVMIVRPGERVAADGRVIDGRSTVDQSTITGEPIPVEKRAGDAVFAGTLNQRGALTVDVTRVGPETTLGRIAKSVEEAEASKAPVQKFADRYSAVFLPVLLIVAAIASLVSGNPQTGIAVLVVACPCAVALATPLAVTASVGASARHGILIKGGLYLEALARADVLVMDKTGTLTIGRPRVAEVKVIQNDEGGMKNEEIVALAASAEKYSEHALAEAILHEAARLGVRLREPESFEIAVGGGVSARVDGRSILLGAPRWLRERGVTFDAESDRMVAILEGEGKTVVGVASAELSASGSASAIRRPFDFAQGRLEAGDASYKLVGLIAASDVLREEVPAAIDDLRRLGLQRMFVLSGDNPRVADAIGKQLGIEARGGMLPEDKIAFVRELQAQGHVVAMIGDGINDAPALAQADVGIAMGAAGTHLAVEAADIALMRDDWSALPLAVRIARRTFGTIRQNIGFGVLFNIAGVTLASVGILTPILAAAAQSLPDVAVFLNSSKLLRIR